MHARLTAASLAILATSALTSAPAFAATLAPAGLGAPSFVVAAAYSQTVRDVQAELNAQGYDAGPADGLMGSRTRVAIEQYQRKHNLLVTGQASGSLLSHIRANTATAPRSGGGDGDREERMTQRTQERLKSLGYTVEATGDMDWQTRSAISAYQRDNNLTVTGDLDRDLARHIRAKANGGGGATADAGGLSAASLLSMERGLELRGYKVGAVDGEVDARTRAAITAYQRDRGIPADGKPTEELAKLLSEGISEDLNTKENIAKVQAALNQRGYTAGPPDGVMGPSTRNAISSYKNSKGLGSSPDVTAKLMESLNIEMASAAPADGAAGAMEYTVRMTDDFEDGDYTQNPAWSVKAGEFTVIKGYLAVAVPPAPGQQLIAGVLSQALGVNVADRPVAAIAQGANFSNAFQIKTQILGAGDQVDGMHLGPYVGNDVSNGYRLVFDQGSNNRLALVALSNGRAVTLKSVDGVSELGDGRRRNVLWTRTQTGEMEVSINDRSVLKATDRSFTGNFDGYSFVATAGAWNIHDVSVASPK